jgi:methyltransferase
VINPDTHAFQFRFRAYTQGVLYAFILSVIVQRLLELRVAKRNEAWARSQGAIEHAPEHYPWMVAMHTAWILAMFFESLARGSQLGAFWFVWLGVFVLAQFGRYWAISSLGPYWNTRILIVPGATLVRRGPYKFMPHPNYVVVALELLTGPLIFGAWITAVIFTILNAIMLLGVRIPAEERALETYRNA